MAVTGTDGFVGSALVRLAGPLVYAQHRGPDAGGFDLAEQRRIETLFDGADVVVHLAGPSAVGKSFAAPAEFARVHAAGTASVLAAAERIGVRRFVHVSSAEVYGRVVPVPVVETAPIAPVSPYGAAKWAGEVLVASAAQRGAFDAVTILRPFSIYGPGLRSEGLVGRLVRQAAARVPMRVFSTAPVRDYVHVDDVVHALMLASARTSGGLLTLNIAAGRPVTVPDLAVLCAEIGGGPSELCEIGSADRPSALDILWLVADISFAERAIEWRPTIALRDGLRSCMADGTCA
ncbi:SDR family oxidoreductase [Sphingomonas baiyangensis]|uniref:SDR family oxidoreductase n=1 Tax=Sphingomonas baiyangensis TaxID=2572576 RepID=A0A4U1L5C1_9SPHN|nr:SDR family oxidoreductase [Sphingomonas baiyangensis]